MRNPIYILMRNDDPGPRSDPQKERRVLEIFEKYYIPQVLAVIPNNVEDPHVYDKGDLKLLEDNPEVIKILKEYHEKGLVEIAQHGYTHQTNPLRPSINHDISDESFYQGIDRKWVAYKPKYREGYSEFSGLDYEQQLEKVQKGKKYLEEIFGFKMDSFIFPWNTHDKNSLKALKACGYKFVPIDDDKYLSTGICAIGCCNWDWHTDRFRELIKQAEKLNKPVVTQFAYHSWEISEEYMHELDKLLNELSSRKNVVFITPNQIPLYVPWLPFIIKLRSCVVILERKIAKIINGDVLTPKYYVKDAMWYVGQIFKLSVTYALAKYFGLFKTKNNNVTIPVNKISFGDFKRVRPIDTSFGHLRGKPVDRYYIEKFLNNNAQSIKGHVLEFEDNKYTYKYGKKNVTKSDVLHLDKGNPKATFIGDLAEGDFLPSDAFDSIICTQTLMFIFDVEKAVKTLHRILKPGGVLLVTVPGIAQICPNDGFSWHDCWRFTVPSARKLFGKFFDEKELHAESFGNVLSAVSVLHGIAVEELNSEDLDRFDPYYPVIIGIKVKKT